MASQITSARLKEILHYDPLSGNFTWLVIPCNPIKVGDRAGSKNADGYIVIGVDGIPTYAHRLAWLWMTGEWPTLAVDHESRRKGDNAWSNLRLATGPENAVNSKVRSDSISGVKGVRWDAERLKWRAHIGHGKKQLFLGRFTEQNDAVNARKAAEKDLYGNFAPV